MSGERGLEQGPQYLELLTKLFCRILLKGVLNRPLEQRDDVTSVQLSCLHYVQRHLQATVSDVAEGLAISRAAATNLVERLVRKGLVVREENPEDRRQVFIRLSDRGRELLTGILASQRDYFQNILARMEPENVAALKQGLRAFLEASLVEAEIARDACVRCGVEHFASCPVALFLSSQELDRKF